MEAFPSHGGFVTFRTSGDVAMPRTAVWTNSNQHSICKNGQSDEDAWEKLSREIDFRYAEQVEPDHL